MKTLIRAAIVGLFLFTLHVAQPAAQPACGEYQCTMRSYPGSGTYCINEDVIDCQCNDFGCMCGYCFCSDNGDCWLMPWQG